MAPAHVPPKIAERIVLEEQVVLAIEQDGSVWIVDPVRRSIEVESWLPGVAAAAADCCDSEGAEKINVNASAIAVTKQAGKKPRPCMGISVAMDE